MTAAVPPAFDEWCVVELLGHRRVVGRVREATFPAGFLRIDEPGGRTQLVSPGALYAMHPVTEAVASKLAGDWRSEPVSRWELERAGAIDAAGDGDDEDEDQDEEGPF